MRPQRLRVTVDAGGCGGFQYRFKVEPAAADSLAEDDVLLERDGAQVVTDSASLEYLRGAVVDFKANCARACVWRERTHADMRRRRWK